MFHSGIDVNISNKQVNNLSNTVLNNDKLKKQMQAPCAK